MKVGGRVRTPRFCTVTIKEVFRSVKEMETAGYTEPTHFESDDYEIKGKSLDAYHMVFAAADKIEHDFRKAWDDTDGDIISCDCCGSTSRVSCTHGEYCPICGPDVVANISRRHTRYKSPFTIKSLKKAEELDAEAARTRLLLSGHTAPDPELLEKCVEVYANSLEEKADKLRDAIRCGDEYGDLSSHDEKQILQGCVRMMNCVAGAFEEYLSMIADEEGDIYINLRDIAKGEEGRFFYELSYSEIVRTLFLSGTHHAGGTSTAAKCRQLGVEDYDVLEFELQFDELEEEEEE